MSYEMNGNVLVTGYGSIGKRHVNNLIQLGIKPIVLTKYPENNHRVVFADNFNSIENIEYAVIATSTNRHLEDFQNLVKYTNCKNVLIEKPIDSSVAKAKEILNISKQKGIKVFVAYNLRFLKVFNTIMDTILLNCDKIRLVNISAGQYLPEWRPGMDYRKSYSASRKEGGGVDLDLSHEIDYMLWCFGKPLSIASMFRNKISLLEIDSPDYFNATYVYNNFIATVEVDYIREKQRYMSIKGENEDILYVDFINKKLIINEKEFGADSLFDFSQSYVMEIKEFLNFSQRKTLCSLEESIDTLLYLKLEKNFV